MKHSGPVSALAAEGRRLATGGYDGAVAVYDLERETFVAMHRAHRGLVTSVATTGTTVFSGGSDARFVVAHLTVGGALLEAGVLGFDDDVEAVLALSDSLALAGLGDGSIHRVHVSRDGQLSSEQMLALSGTITSIRNFDSSHVVATCNDGTLRLLDPLTNGCTDAGVLYRSALPLKNCIAVHDIGMVVTGGHDGTLIGVSVRDNLITRIHEFDTSVRGLAATPSQLYVGVYDGTLHKFDLPSLKYRGEVSSAAPAGEPWTRQLVSTSDGDVFVAGFDGMPIRVETPERARVNSNINALVRGAVPDEFVLGTDNGGVLCVRITDECGLVIDQLHSVGACVTSMAVDDRGRVAASTWDGRLLIGQQEILRVREPLLGLTWLDEDVLAVGTYSGSVLRVGADGRTSGKVQALPSSVKSIAYHGGRAYAVGRYGPMAIINVRSWRVDGAVSLDTRVSDAVALSPSGDLLAVAAAQNEVWVFRTKDIQEPDAAPVFRLGGHTKPPKAVAWDGEDVVLSVGYDSQLIRHDIRSGTPCVVSLHATIDVGLSGVASAGRGRAIIAGFDGSVRLIGFNT